MPTSEQILATAIAELRCIDPDRSPSMSDLHALQAARQCIDSLLGAYVPVVRADEPDEASWAAIAISIGAPSADAARKRFPVAPSDALVDTFWNSHREHFQWSFLPSSFLYALYRAWMTREHQGAAPVPAATLTRRLKTITGSSGEWSHTRLRPTALLDRPEPLLALAAWRPTHDGRAIRGFLRTP